MLTLHSRIQKTEGPYEGEKKILHEGLFSEMSDFKVCPLQTVPECLRFGSHCVKPRNPSEPL